MYHIQPSVKKTVCCSLHHTGLCSTPWCLVLSFLHWQFLLGKPTHGVSFGSQQRFEAAKAGPPHPRNSSSCWFGNGSGMCASSHWFVSVLIQLLADCRHFSGLDTDTNSTRLWLQSEVQEEVQHDELGVTPTNVKPCSDVGVANLQLLSVWWFYTRTSPRWGTCSQVCTKLRNYSKMCVLDISDFYQPGRTLLNARFIHMRMTVQCFSQVLSCRLRLVCN